MSAMKLSRSVWALAGAIVAGVALAGPLAAEPGRNIGPGVPEALKAPISPLKGGYACVNANGTLSGKKKNVVSVTKVAGFAGDYIVRFTSSVSSCVYVATIGLCGNAGVESPGEVTVTRAAATASGVYVDTRNSSGVDADRGFNLVVSCP